jgi:hypothetical protein
MTLREYLAILKDQIQSERAWTGDEVEDSRPRDEWMSVCEEKKRRARLGCW